MTLHPFVRRWQPLRQIPLKSPPNGLQPAQERRLVPCVECLDVLQLVRGIPDVETRQVGALHVKMPQQRGKNEAEFHVSVWSANG